VETNADPIPRGRGVRSILFICTGNTCRSPLAETLCKRQLAKSLGCSVPELRERGFVVQSAGLAAAYGQPATPEAVLVAEELGADLTQHRSQPISEALLSEATNIFVMTRSQLLLLVDYFPEKGSVTRTLSPAGGDIDDPIGCELSVYRDCSRSILLALEALLPAL
jgi:protein-tyrosine-phosphatase